MLETGKEISRTLLVFCLRLKIVFWAAPRRIKWPQS